MENHDKPRKHSPYELFRIMTMILSRDRPFKLNLEDALSFCQAITSDNYGLLTTVVDSEGVVDLSKFAQIFSKEYGCPIIYYKGHRYDNDTVDVMRKLNTFLQANGLTEKNLITFNFPADNNEYRTLKAAGFSPNVINVVPSVSERFGFKNVNEIESFFENTTTRLTLNNNLEENCNRVKNAIDQCMYTSKLNRDSGFHLQRIILLGQIGSGRKTQSRLLAKRWNLVFLDFRVLLLRYAKLNKEFDEHLSKVQSVHQLNRKLVASILFERITKRDCLENGWILVGYVSSVADLEVMENNFFIIPNKIVFIHCRQHLCLDRLRTKVIKNAEINECRHSSKNTRYAKLGFLDLYSPCCAISHVVTEIDHFCRNRREILKYCQDRAKYIAHIDGEHSVSTVTTLLWGQVEKFNF
ncbi:uncharacterized protein LOC119074950 [Bradysia coprophila]|uniref:uncharacterized protein LOC119074950 n=1 Tax=Bradysia coprophila TaxID=38358 RepID=UPI00187DAE35|nr:uncharacterized protein LOC119074950 [Bradysia coprophila]